MPSFEELKYGYSKTGLSTYLDAIKATVITKVAEDIVSKVEDVCTGCDAIWSGKAKDNFCANLRKDATHVAEQYKELYTVLEAEISNAMAVMAKQDNDLISSSY